MVASNTLELPYYKSIGRQRGRGFGGLAQVIGRTAIPFLKKYIVPAAKRVGADLLEFAVPEAADVVSGKKNFKTAAKKHRKTDIEKTTWRWQAKENHSSQKFEAKQSVTQKHFYQFCKLIMTDLNNFRYQPFVTVSGNPGLKVPVVDDVLSSHEHETYPTTSLDENSIEFEIQTDRNVYVDLRQTCLALKIKLVKGRGFDTYKTTEKKKEHKEDTVSTETSDDDVEFIEEDEGVPHIAHVNNILHSLFSNAELYINNHQIYDSDGLYAHKSHISNNFKSTLSDYKGVSHCEGFDYEEDPENLVEGPFFTRSMKLYSRLDGFMLYGKLGIDFVTTSELFYPNMKVRIRIIRARPRFYMISENPNVSLGIVDCSLYTRRVMLKEDYHKKRRSQLAYAPVEYNYMGTLAKTFIIPTRQNQFIQEYIFNNAPIRRIAIATNSNSAFTGSFAENPFWYQQFGLRDIRILRGLQPIVHHDTTDKCRWYVTTMKAMNFKMIFHQTQLIISKTITY